MYEFTQARSDKTETATRNLFCQRCTGSQVCESKDIYSTVQSCVPRVPWTQTPFCRTRSLFLTAFVMMRHCLKLASLKWTTDVNEKCCFPFNPACYLYISIEIWRWKNAVNVVLNGFIAIGPRADVYYEIRFCSQRKAVEYVIFYKYLSTTTRFIAIYLCLCLIEDLRHLLSCLPLIHS